MEYYSIPLRVDHIGKGMIKDDEMDIKKSIHQNIRLILKSFTLSYRFDSKFGCVMNKFTANTPPQNKSIRVWREAMREEIQRNLKDMMQRYETRIAVQELMVDFQNPKFSNKESTMFVKVNISGNLTLGRNDKFHYPDSEIEEEAQEVFPLMIPTGKIK